MKITTPKATLDRQVGRNKLREGRSGGDGNTFPLRVAKVTRVDSKSLVLDLRTLSGNSDTYENVPMTFPSAGARHFIGAIPQVNDLCIIGYTSAESGFNRTPYIVNWLVPGYNVGYDWLVTQVTDPDQLEYNPKTELELQGLYGKRRHKLRQMDEGNVVMSSSQGSDIILSEGLTLANRRGNELILRDSDQSLVVRTLQQFHAGSGFRVYGGMVQRDANLLPTWLVDDGVDYSNPKQLDNEGNPLVLDELDLSDNPGQVKINPVFSEDELRFGGVDPKSTLQKGLFMDEEGQLIDTKSVSGATYGGKNFYRVSKDLFNSVTDTSMDTFTEYRIEVAHTADGTLPVTEQTDGIDIDRLPPSLNGDSSTKDLNSNNKSKNSAMVEMVMGTVIGNDSIGSPESYGVPIIASVHDEQGKPNPSLKPAPPNTPISQHLAWMVKVNNPTGSTPPAFMAITKGGALKSYFPGKGSDTYEEFYESGRITSLHTDPKGVSQKFQVQGSFEVEHNGQGSKKDNTGIKLETQSGFVKLYGGGFSTDLEGRVGLSFETPNTIEAVSKTFRMINTSTNIQGTQLNVNTEDSILLSTSTMNLNTEGITSTINGDKAETIHGGYSIKFTKPALIDDVFTIESVNGGYNFSTKVGNVVNSTSAGGISIVGGDLKGIITDKIKSLFPVPFLFSKVKVPLAVELHSGINSGYSADIVLHPTEGVQIQSTRGINLDSPLGVVGVNTAKMELDASVSTTISTKFLYVKGVGVGITENVLTDQCKCHLTGRTFRLSGTTGNRKFKVR